MEVKNIEDIQVEILKGDHCQYDLSFKMIIIGDPGVGKSCLTKQARDNIFDEAYSATVGFEFITLTLKLDNKVVKLQIWDTCGQEIYRSLISSFYRNATLAMIVYAIDSRKSFSHINSWLKDVQLLSNPDIKIFLIGNKKDLESNREINTDEAKQFANKNGINYFNETSAKNGFNAKEVFIRAAKELYLEQLKYKNRAVTGGNRDHNSKNIGVPTKINKSKEEKRNKGGCC